MVAPSGRRGSARVRAHASAAVDLSPEVIARIAEVLGNSRMWTPPPEWTSPPPSPSVAPPTTPPPQPLWSAGRDYLRPSDEFGAMRRTPGLGAPVPSEERSLADRLRPPYTTPMPGANPANAGASRMLEQGFGRLDPAAQRALQRPGPPLDVGQSPEGAPGGARNGRVPPHGLGAHARADGPAVDARAGRARRVLTARVWAWARRWCCRWRGHVPSATREWCLRCMVDLRA